MVGPGEQVRRDVPDHSGQVTGDRGLQTEAGIALDQAACTLIEESVTSMPAPFARVLTAEWKHAEKPAANSCSGLVGSPGPAPGFGLVRVRSRTPSVVRDRPFRPLPVETAVVR